MIIIQIILTPKKIKKEENCDINNNLNDNNSTKNQIIEMKTH